MTMITEYEIRFTLPTDIGKVPENFREFLNILEKLGIIEHFVKVEESVEYDLSEPNYSLSRKAIFVINKKE
jgi:hypothetical protein